jgi:uncharacterized protein (TIGR02246 family)
MEETMHKEEQAIRTLVAEWLDAASVADLPKLLALMSEDVVFLQPGAPPLRGRDAFATAFQAGGHPRIKWRWTAEEIQVTGDLAYAWSHLAVTIPPPLGGTPLRKAGYLLTIFRKTDDGYWVLARDANLLTNENDDA